MKKIKAVQSDFFDPKAIFHHCQGMAKNANSELNLNEPIKLKKCFYLLRALLASMWTIEQNSPPPMDFHQLLPLITVSEKTEILELVAVKQNQSEDYRHILSKGLQDLTVKLWQRCDSPVFSDKRQEDVAVLDEIFSQTIFA